MAHDINTCLAALYRLRTALTFSFCASILCRCVQHVIASGAHQCTSCLLMQWQQQHRTCQHRHYSDIRMSLLVTTHQQF
jgi:hypothetical protein